MSSGNPDWRDDLPVDAQQRREVFARYGVAMYYAQCLEHQLGLMLASMYNHGFLTVRHEARDALFDQELSKTSPDERPCSPWLARLGSIVLGWRVSGDGWRGYPSYRKGRGAIRPRSLDRPPPSADLTPAISLSWRGHHDSSDGPRRHAPVWRSSCSPRAANPLGEPKADGVLDGDPRGLSQPTTRPPEGARLRTGGGDGGAVRGPARRRYRAPGGAEDAPGGYQTG